MSKIINVILSGGFGTRLWPLSTPDNPKQFLKIFGGKSLFQHTVLRNRGLVDRNMILTNENHYKIALEQINELNSEFDYKVLEPIPRNTAPAITLAALSVDENDILFVTPSDHMIADEEVYEECVSKAVGLAKDGFLTTFSIKPSYAETGYGYIEFQGNNVLSFREKPDAKTAKGFVESGNFYWNSGMFCFKAGIFLEEIKKYSPEIYEKSLKAYRNGIDEVSMKEVPEDSVDYAVFEKSDIIKTVPSSFKWDDLGNFDSLINYFTENDFGSNSLVKSIGGVDVNNCSALSSKRVIGVGLNDLNIIEAEDTILILPKGEGQLVKDLYKLQNRL
ncbi:mannose-1-phosphate guanylyltransferase [Galbibacter orientalis DSM 19592]|uniref:Mannose-1-phosphate guanylyltransferase n=1 Tax=Galbibacter orientalis DSM 19592 TaxID=926559 RepID=I3C795_9FLAO|nr:sugar phosphate nucleotidyltransferase [Galbibacter orientalis]EIJ39488.1 mannose-1-phosphate guanylyltransferase [Galbibacter orientalis DSM 19592]